MPKFYICRRKGDDVIHDSDCPEFKRFRGQSQGPFHTRSEAEDAHAKADFFGNNPCWTHRCAREADSPLIRALQDHFERYGSS
jgi:hypothetical protein